MVTIIHAYYPQTFTLSRYDNLFPGLVLQLLLTPYYKLHCFLDRMRFFFLPLLFLFIRHPPFIFALSPSAVREEEVKRDF